MYCKSELRKKATNTLKTMAKKKGFPKVNNVTLINDICTKRMCTGAGKGTGIKTTISYSIGNSVNVSNKRALIKSISGSNYTVQFADGSTRSVPLSSLSVP